MASKEFLIALLVLSLAGCAPRGPVRESRAAVTPIEVTVESSLDEERRELETHPLEFELTFPEATLAWDRARLFFNTYTTRFEEIPVGSDAAIISNRKAADDDLVYEIRRSAGREGARFLVSARPRDPAVTAKINPQLVARNVARFIRSSRLDLTLLPNL